MNLPEIPSAPRRESAASWQRANAVAEAAIRQLKAQGISGATLIGCQGGVPLIAIDPPPPGWTEARVYWRYERPTSIKSCVFSSWAGATLVWIDVQPKPCCKGRTH